MALYLIAYDSEHRSIEASIALAGLGAIRILSATWLLSSRLNREQIFNLLVDTIGKYFIIAELSGIASVSYALNILRQGDDSEPTCQ
ncbi:MAG: hypothetical protein ABSB35_21820 [Bryobacteraceae bacterium]|jgi:hypothetical protein